jgi:hypothetical protein
MGTAASATQRTPQSPLALVCERDRRRLDEAKDSKASIDLTEISPESVAAALACYIPNFVPNEELLQAWLKGGGSERTVDGLRRILRDSYGLEGSVPVEAVARATMEWHVQYYFNTPLVVPDPEAKVVSKDSDDDIDVPDVAIDLPRVANPRLRRASLPPLCQDSSERLQAMIVTSQEVVPPIPAPKKVRNADSMLCADVFLAQAMMGVLLRRWSAPGVVQAKMSPSATDHPSARGG